MQNETQLERYKKLLEYLDKQFKEEVNIEKVEAISHYSYRNINRIFEALHHETIGKYVKRIRLEKATDCQRGQTHQNNDFDIALFLDWHF